MSTIIVQRIPGTSFYRERESGTVMIVSRSDQGSGWVVVGSYKDGKLSNITGKSADYAVANGLEIRK